MKYRVASALWAVLFVLCAGLGFIPQPAGGLRVVLTLLSVAFFIPGGLLLFWGYREKKFEWVRLVRNLAFSSLLAAMVLLAANVLSAVASEAVGQTLYVLLVIVAAPLVCSGYYALSLFLWACLLMSSLFLLRRAK